MTLVVPSILSAQVLRGPENAPPDWHPEPYKLTEQCDRALTRVRGQIAGALTTPLERRTFDYTLKPIELAVTNFAQEVYPLTFLYQVSPDSALRAASASCDQKVSSFYVEFSANPEIFATATALGIGNAGATPADRKLIALYRESGEHAGAGLDRETRRRTAALFKRLNDLQREFGIALGADTSTITVNSAGLAGLTPEFVATLKRTSSGDYSIPVNESTYSLVMRNASVSDTRERWLRAFVRVGGDANVVRLSKALAIRDSLARLMGVPNWATYQLQTKGAKTPDRVLKFLNDLDTTLLPKARAEFAERVELKKASGDATPYKPWDYQYYGAQLLKQKYSVDDKEVRQYFPVSHVIPAVMNIYSHLLGVRFIEYTKANAWAPDVRRFQVVDTATQKPLGTIFLDLYPRPNKYNHFAQWTLRSRISRADGSTDQMMGAIVGNWPTPAPGKPSLLSHGDVITFFHEFGHLMAATFAASPYLTNLNLRQDFVEAPSQMLENWMWRPEVLKLVSRNVATGKSLPADLIERMVAAKHMSDGLNGTTQVFYGLYDMTLATSPPTIDATALWYDLITKLTPGEAAPGGFPEGQFGHLMSGYDAGYYGYLWSKVYAQDLFTRFDREGLLDPKVGRAYRELVLEPGGLLEPDEILQNFLGRALSYDAFYTEMGITRQ